MFLNPSTEFIANRRPIIKNLSMDRQLKSNGFRLSDNVRINPIYGKKKMLKCLKTKYYFTNEDNDFRTYTDSQIIKLPCLKNDDFILEFSLFHQNRISQNEDNCRFLLASKNDQPFILNGQLVMSAFIERGDKVIIGDNQLQFEQERELSSDFFQIDFDKNLKLIRSSLPILIQGETGTGKTHLAKEIHHRSGNLGPFVHINLSSFSKGVLESELFGHKKGAFTGALSDKVGALAQAQDGTLFIDEIDSLPWDIQTKLLLFLDDQKVRAVGANEQRQVNTRIVFSSGQCLKKLVEDGKMRKDFYFRLRAGQTVQLESLRDNIENITRFCQLFCMNNSITMTTKLLDFYTSLPWPGNYRELKGHLERKKILSHKDKLDFDEVDEELITQSSEILSFEKNEELTTLEEIKKQYCRKVFFHYNENIKLSADKLNINAKTLKRMLGA